MPKRIYHWVQIVNSDMKIRALDPHAVKVRIQSHRREPWTVTWAKCFSAHETVFEIGTNIGVFTLLFARHAKTHAFEPSRFAYEELLANLDYNGISSVVANKTAISDRSGMVEFAYSSTKAEDGVHGVGSLPLGGEPVLVEKVPAVTLDEYGTVPDHIYIDTDGHEVAVLRGAGCVLTKTQSMICEFHGEDNFRAVLPQLQDAGLTPLMKWTRLKANTAVPWFQVFIAREAGRWDSVLKARAKRSVVEDLRIPKSRTARD